MQQSVWRCMQKKHYINKWCQQFDRRTLTSLYFHNWTTLGSIYGRPVHLTLLPIIYMIKNMAVQYNVIIQTYE